MCRREWKSVTLCSGTKLSSSHIYFCSSVLYLHVIYIYIYLCMWESECVSVTPIAVGGLCTVFLFAESLCYFILNTLLHIILLVWYIIVDFWNCLSVPEARGCVGSWWSVTLLYGCVVVQVCSYRVKFSSKFFANITDVSNVIVYIFFCSVCFSCDQME